MKSLLQLLMWPLIGVKFWIRGSDGFKVKQSTTDSSTASDNAATFDYGTHKKN